MMIVLHGKHYYPADVYPILIGAGGAAIEAWTAALRFVRLPITAVTLLAGVAIAPLTLPVLPESTFTAYNAALMRALHLPANATETEPGRDRGALPGDWADMHGWQNMASIAKRVYDSLPPAQRAHAVVFAGNYGEASAVEFFAPGVPVISEHNQYWLWGTRGYDGNTIVQINGSCFHSDHLYRSRVRAATVHDRWAISYENGIPVWICRGIKQPLASIWPKIKLYE
jgi:hypothetical protein